MDARKEVMIVTGGSRGIGAATTRLAAARGFDVCVNYRSDGAAAQSVVEAAQRLGRRAIAVQGNMANEADIVRLFQAAERELGRPTALVNNAGGVVGTRRRVEALRWEDAAGVVALNLTGLMICCREAILRMSTRHGGQGGAIVNVSSVSARLGAPNLWMDYAAAKGGVDTFTAGLAIEVAEEAIRVNAVRPGLIDTDLHATVGMPDRVERAARHLPMKRAGTAEEVAEAIVWLASANASYVSGSILDVAGAR
jgi:NAD(P)-dependent dehydrogenase (short-subunit alcohol dehydrogenase family)